MQFHCITPPHIIEKMQIKDDVLINERHRFPREELRQIVLLDFDVVTGPNGQRQVAFR
jgi:hypothetical protein